MEEVANKFTFRCWWCQHEIGYSASFETAEMPHHPVAGAIVANGTPQFKHDCQDCQFLGRFHGIGVSAYRGMDPPKDHDLYYHAPPHSCNSSGSTIIARYGDNGLDYVSGKQFGEQDRFVADSALGEAWRWADKLGLDLT